MKQWILIGILLLAAFFRLYHLSSVPPSPSLDEVSIGYNAYSLVKTGADEYNTPHPMLLRAYDDYRPALYVYLVAPFVAVLGLVPIAVRLPSVMLSLVTIYFTYCIGSMIGKKYLSFAWLGEFASLMLAVSPWHVYISRLGHEANIGLTLVVIAIYFLLRAVVGKKSYALVMSGIAFGLSVHGYQSEKIIMPVLLGGSVVLFWKSMWQEKKYAVLSTLVLCIIVVPAILATVSPQGLARFAGTSAFSQNDPIVVTSQKRYLAARTNGDIIQKFQNSQYVVYASIAVNNYLSHFSPGWLFFGRDREAFKAPGLGLFYPWEFPLFILGVWALWRARVPKAIKLFLLLWIVTAPLPAAVTTQAPHAMRSFTLIPAVQIIEALGIWFLMHLVHQRQRFIVPGLLGLFVVISSVMLWQGYFVRFPREQSDSFQYPMREVIKYANAHAGDYTHIAFFHQGSLYQSYMFYLFFTEFDPKTYHLLGGTKSGGYDNAHYIGKFSFGYLPTKKNQFSPDTLYFYTSEAFPEGLRSVAQFHNLDGSPAIVAGVL